MATRRALLPLIVATCLLAGACTDDAPDPVEIDGQATTTTAGGGGTDGGEDDTTGERPDAPVNTPGETGDQALGPSAAFADVAFTSTPMETATDAQLELIDEGLDVIDEWFELAWSQPAEDPHGYDYRTWVDALAAPDADTEAMAAGPVEIGADEFNERISELREMRAGDLRSALWLSRLRPDTGSWQALEQDPAFKVVSVTQLDSDFYSLVDNPEELDEILQPAVDSHAETGEALRVRIPFAVQVVSEHTTEDGPVRSTLTLTTTVELAVTANGPKIATTWSHLDAFTTLRQALEPLG